MAHPRMYEDSNPTIKKLREICLALPEVFEKEAWGECTFRVTGGSMFAMTDNNHHGSGHVAVWIKAPAMDQEILGNTDPKQLFVPPYMGKRSEEHTSELQSRQYLVCRLLLEKKKKNAIQLTHPFQLFQLDLISCLLHLVVL